MERKEMKNGYDIELVDSLPTQFLCPFCKLLMRNPIQTFRGGLACEYCYKHALGSTNGLCPIDQEPISLNEIFRDKRKSLEINDLQCFCNNKQYGCLWKDTVGNIENHHNICQFKAKECEYCQDNVLPNLMTVHFKTCSGILQRNVCIYKDVGCDYKPVNANDVVDHLKDDAVPHSALHISYLRNIQIKFHNQLEHQNEEARNKEMKLQNDYDSLLKKITVLSDSVGNLERKTDGNNILARQAPPETDSEKTAILQELDRNTKEIDKIDASYSVLSANVSELDLKQQLMENSSYDGKLLWKVDNYSLRLNQAITGKVTALHSAPCFTSKYGYKFCARLYLNGDGIGRNTHMSLFFVSMKSEYDNLLQWPFNRRVTFKLINQESESENLKETFIPDRNSSSFQKPTRQMNVAAGCPMFITKELLNSGGFIKDDCLFIEISA